MLGKKRSANDITNTLTIQAPPADGSIRPSLKLSAGPDSTMKFIAFFHAALLLLLASTIQEVTANCTTRVTLRLYSGYSSSPWLRDEVQVLQTKLRSKGYTSVVVDGYFGSGTQSAVLSYQRSQRLVADGIVGSQTWSRLCASTGGTPPSSSYRQPTLGSGLCAYGSASKRYGKSATMSILEGVGRNYRVHGEGSISLGNISLNGGGRLAPHSSHRVGLDVDIRPMRTDNNQCNSGMQWNWAGYDRSATRKLVQALRATGKIKSILFNDPTLIEEGLVTKFSGHDNHLHVRFCETGHSSSSYRC